MFRTIGIVAALAAFAPRASLAENFEQCIGLSVEIFGSPGNGAFANTFENRCDLCIKFSPIARALDGSGDCPMSNFIALGQPISAVSLEPGSKIMLIHNCGFGTRQSVALNPRECL